MNLDELKNNWNRIFPLYPCVQVSPVTITESGKEAKLTEMVVTPALCLSFQTAIVKDMKGFLGKVTQQKAFNNDCDGAIIFEYNEKFYFFLIELKSNFDTGKLLDARKQITSTYIKLNILLNMVDGYDKSKVEFRGLIASLEPTLDDKLWLSKMNLLSDEEP
ncbi:hypothetical protein [Bacteroides sp. 519]|uniref:hypothetical protein n=1 Tax=Bacteroides sp. 519 TaxID=2302937 RepID=UPI0013D2AE9B|nr:hypothetical protein [Bacteroides sp. 519]NDV57208.1 hypothetical protein [Bacteroides sp. 519]